MASRIRLIDVTKMKKSSWLVQQESEVIVKSAKEGINRQKGFMDSVGMDKKKLREFINGDAWPANFKHKARQELIKFNDELKSDLSHEASLKRKEIRLANRLLKPKTSSRSSGRRHRTGFV
ncbi:hypothetical protein [Endozoicomonas numazuensis]|uniref:Uncharacterized protein n=1 Tax=Endozoicomonas numazuensis TaxID=1137799 RepID=A0A081NMC2_9GAMM|nr:hypothetical protein [Endozoicomonas numazuensis]KEQ19595.1 hypothetical protein GZ78_06755 [Endozoicomonas numazuensis]